MQEPSVNPLLAKVKLPGRVFQLPSKGLFYEPGVLAETVKDGEVQVHPMSALAEMKIRSADLLYTGKVLRELCQECAPDIMKPELMLTKDVDALFAFFRIVTYGNKLQLNSMHDCKGGKLHQHEIDLEPLFANANNAILAHRDTLYRSVLSNKQIVMSKPPTYEEAMQVVQIKHQIAKLESDGELIDDALSEKIMMTDMLAVIASVEVEDGTVVTSKEFISQWIRAMPRPLLDEVLAGIRKTDKWGYEFVAKLTCKDCGKPYDHQLELDPINFFYG